MKVELIHKILELIFPFLDIFRTITIKLLALIVGADEFDACGSAKYFLFGLIFGPNNLEDGIECNHKAFLLGLVIKRVKEDRFGCQNQRDGQGVIWLEVVGGGEDRIRRGKLTILLKEFSLLWIIHIIIYTKQRSDSIDLSHNLNHNILMQSLIQSIPTSDIKKLINTPNKTKLE